MKLTVRDCFGYRELLSILAICVLICAVLAESCARRSITEEELQQIAARSAASDVQRFVLNRVREYDVVMLADHGHGEARYMQIVNSVLDRWVDSATSGDSDQSLPHSLALVLELDPIQAGAVRQYALTGDVQPLLTFDRFWSPIFTTANLEFYSRIGRVLRKIADYNSDEPDSARQLKLLLFGPEKVIDSHSWSRQEAQQYFLTERDSLCADQIAEMVAGHPRTHVIVYYGSAHLSRSKMTLRADERETEGFRLAHYLSERFPGERGVYTIGQPRPADWGAFGSVFEGIPRPFVLDHKELASLGEGGTQATFYDASINLQDIPQVECPLYRVPSERLIRFVLDSAATILDTENFYSARYWPTIIDYLEIVNGEVASRVNLHDPVALRDAIANWRMEAGSGQMDFPTSIANLTYWTKLIDRYQRLDPRTDAAAARRYDELIDSTLPGEAPIELVGNRWPSPRERAADHRKYLDENRQRLVTGLLVNLLWVGSDAERERAIALLAKETGNKFQSPPEWMAWWRGEAAAKDK